MADELTDIVSEIEEPVPAASHQKASLVPERPLVDVSSAQDDHRNEAPKLSSPSEESLGSCYTNDESAIWAEFREGLLKQGFRSSVIEKHKEFILERVKNLEEAGMLDRETADDEKLDGVKVGDDESSRRRNSEIVKYKMVRDFARKSLIVDRPLGRGGFLRPSRVRGLI